MEAYFGRHTGDKVSKNWGNKEEPSPGYVAHKLWGGDSGMRWARNLVKEMKKRDEQAEKEEKAKK